MEEVFNNLTLYQKIALESDVSELLKGAENNEDILFKIYYLLKHIPKEVAVPFLAITRELVLLPEDKIDRIVLSVSLDEFPEWLWLDKGVADIHFALDTCYQEQTPAPVKLDKKAIKQNLVRSAFIRYIRNVACLSTLHASKMLNAVIEDDTSDFLNEVCFSLRNELAEMSQSSNLKNLDDLFKIKIDCKRGLITYTEETKALERLIKFEQNPKQFIMEMEAEKRANEESDNIVNGINLDILDSINKQIEDVLNAARENIKKEEPKEVTYVVSKAFIGRETEASALREFKTAAEARNFIKSMETQYPELLNTCRFIISEKENNGKKV